MSATDSGRSETFDGFVVGPDDWLVLVAKPSLPSEVLEDVQRKVPEALLGRVLVVDGTSFDAKVVRR